MAHQSKPGPVGDVPRRSQLHGHEPVLRTVLGGLATGRGAQAYLFVGPPGVGKSTFARHVAQWLLCSSDGEPKPCGACRGCRLVVSGTHPDLTAPAPPLKVDAVRDLQRRLALAPMEAGVQVAILDDVDRGSPGAGNCLLKTLEEPPSAAVLILTATDEALVLPTIRSRCRVHPLRPLSVAAATRAIVGEWALEESDAERLARLSGGRLGWAARALDDASVLESRGEWLDRLAHLLAADTAGRLEAADGLSRKTDAFREGLQLWIGWWRDVLHLQLGLDAAVVNQDRGDGLREAAGRFGLADTVRALRATEAAVAQLSGNANPTLAAAVLLMEMPR